MEASLKARRAIVQDYLTGQLLAYGWISGDQQANLRETGTVTLSTSADADTEAGDSTPRWTVSTSCALGEDLLLLQTTVHPDLSLSGSPPPFIQRLEMTLEERRASTADKSYTRSLLAGGASTIGAKLKEEADELACAIADEGDERVTNEAADLLYHLLVGLRLRRLSVRRVIEVLLKRTGQSGLQEKASRRQ